MRTGIGISITHDDRRRLERIISDRNRSMKHIALAKVILATADGFGTNEIVRSSSLSKPNVWRWQERFMHEGVDGLLRGFGLKVGHTTLRTFEGRVRELVEGHPTLATIADALLAARSVLHREFQGFERRV